MVQIADWPRLSPQCAVLFRQAAEVVLRPRADWIEELHTASLSGPRMRVVAADPVLAGAIRRANLANLLHWAAENVRQPGLRVPANLGADVLETARDLVRRGLDGGALDAYRAAQGVAWRRWIEVCFELTADPAELRQLLDVSALSIAVFIDDTIAAVAERMEAERADLTRGAHAERRAVVTLLLEGAPISRSSAENQLGYGLTGPHTAAIVWSTAAGAAGELEVVAEAVMRSAGVARRLTVVAGTATLWIWLPAGTAPDPGEMSAHPGVHVAIGRPGTGADGFRRSHLDAATTQRMLTRLTSPRQAARYADVQLVDLLTTAPAQADEFLADTLGGLLHADADTRETVATYLRERCNTTRTAERLYTHRNTVLRRLARADQLLPRPLAENVLSVGAALEVLHWRG